MVYIPMPNLRRAVPSRNMSEEKRQFCMKLVGLSTLKLTVI